MEKVQKICLSILFIIVILLSIAQFALSIILISKINSDFKNLSFRNVDINISAIKSFYFTEFSSRPRYSPSDINLGLAGDLYLDCYTGNCNKTIEKIDYYCDEDNNCEELLYYRYELEIFKPCSVQCFELKNISCDVCSSDYNSKKGYCSRNTDDNYDDKKVCFGDNIIYFWKGKKYNIESYRTKKLTYINDARLKDEPCPNKTKYCGTIDKNENKLCLPLYLDCPINYISEKKLNEKYNYSSTIIDGKTFYYTYDNSSNNKIIAGLYADSDLYLNKDEEEFITLDTYSIRGLLKDNYILYRGVDLGYDPYKISNIDEKGKSYLKIKYNSENPDLVTLRKDYQNFVINREMNEKVVKSVRTRFKTYFILGMVAYIILIIVIFILLYDFYNSKDFYGYLIFLVFFIFATFGLVKACKNISKFNKAKKIDESKNYNTIRTINLLYVIFGFTIYGLILVSIPVYFIIKLIIKKCNKYKEYSARENNNISHDNTKTDIVNDISKQTQ